MPWTDETCQRRGLAVDLPKFPDAEDVGRGRQLSFWKCEASHQRVDEPTVIQRYSSDMPEPGVPLDLQHVRDSRRAQPPSPSSAVPHVAHFPAGSTAAIASAFPCAVPQWDASRLIGIPKGVRASCAQCQLERLERTRTGPGRQARDG